MEASSPQIVWLSTLPRQFGIIFEKILDRNERSGIAVQWNGGGGLCSIKCPLYFFNHLDVEERELVAFILLSS